MKLTNKDVAALPPATAGQYQVRDTELKCFMVVVNRGSKSYTIQVDTRKLGIRHTHREVIGRTDVIGATEARKVAKVKIGELQTGARAAPGRKIILSEAWDSYSALLNRRIEAGERGANTARLYNTIVPLCLDHWMGTELRDLSDDPGTVAEHHHLITRDRGPYMANQAMRLLRAVYRHALKTRMERDLPIELPTDAVEWNPEVPLDTGMAQSELADWYKELRAMQSPIREEFHLFCLLSGSRPDALRRAEWVHVDMKRRMIHFPDPKGGKLRAFDMPISRHMACCMARSRRAGRIMYGQHAETYIFPGADGCLKYPQERRTRLSKFGRELRQTYRTALIPAGVDEITSELLLNHKPTSTSRNYITKSALDDHLIAAQEQVSKYIVAGLKKIIA